jgi:transcriptional regulator with XRE-family HTH domain
MTSTTSQASRFREIRERAGLTRDEVANSLLISGPSVWDIETHDDELSSCYSPRQVQKLCQVLRVRPAELLGIETAGSPISAAELVRLIHEQCRSCGVTPLPLRLQSTPRVGGGSAFFVRHHEHSVTP